MDDELLGTGSTMCSVRRGTHLLARDNRAALVYSVTLEHGSDGSYLAWVHDLPGCFARAGTREAVLESVEHEIHAFARWLAPMGETVEEADGIEVVAEVESLIDADEDTEALVATDREPLTKADWERTERWLAQSRRDLRSKLEAMSDEMLEAQADADRTVRELLVHVGFVELMYAMWTFDLRSKAGLAEFLAWTRSVSTARMSALATSDASTVTYADWAGAPRLEEWTARKAARRLVWHELLHTRELGANAPSHDPN
jgi:hypothetical protein